MTIVFFLVYLALFLHCNFHVLRSFCMLPLLLKTKCLKTQEMTHIYTCPHLHKNTRSRCTPKYLALFEWGSWRPVRYIKFKHKILNPPNTSNPLSTTPLNYLYNTKLSFKRTFNFILNFVNYKTSCHHKTNHNHTIFHRRASIKWPVCVCNYLHSANLSGMMKMGRLLQRCRKRRQLAHRLDIYIYIKFPNFN